MKRLVDETTDELTRSLLSAGIEHRPPPGNKAQVIAALGAGGAVGLFSSNAFAWLSTTAGKVTAVGVAVGVAGAVWVAAPASKPASSASASNAHVTAPLRASNEAPSPGLNAASENDAKDARLGNDGDEPRGGEPNVPAVAGSAVAEPGVGETTGDGSALSVAAADERASSPARRERTRRAKRGSATQRAVASQPSERQRDGRQLAVPETPPMGAALAQSSDEQAQLDAEVRLVDDMHWAARRNDRDALGRYLAQYESSFPDGQLKKEVAEFAARLERPGTSSEN